jgi:hypothetical protein
MGALILFLPKERELSSSSSSWFSLSEEENTAGDGVTDGVIVECAFIRFESRCLARIFSACIGVELCSRSVAGLGLIDVFSRAMVGEHSEPETQARMGY